MIWVDYCILAVTLISIIAGILRGFTKEFFNLLTWTLAIILALVFGDQAAVLLEHKISIPALRIAAGHAIIFLGGLLIGAIVSSLLVESVSNSRFASADRTLGGGFGFLRALFLVAVFIMVAANMGAKQDKWWHQSLFVGRMEWLAEGLQILVPERWLETIRPEKHSAKQDH